MHQSRRQFTPDFKLEAARLARESQKLVTQVARELEISPDLLHRWMRQAAAREGFPSREVFPGPDICRARKKKRAGYAGRMRSSARSATS